MRISHGKAMDLLVCSEIQCSFDSSHQAEPKRLRLSYSAEGRCYAGACNDPQVPSSTFSSVSYRQHPAQKRAPRHFLLPVAVASLSITLSRHHSVFDIAAGNRWLAHQPVLITALLLLLCLNAPAVGLHQVSTCSRQAARVRTAIAQAAWPRHPSGRHALTGS